MDLKERDLKTIKYRVINIARKFGVVQDNWDDLIQDVILYILENIDMFDTNRSWNAWLYTVSKNATLRFVMQYKIPVVIPKSTWQRQTADMKKSYTDTTSLSNWSAMNEAFRKGFDPTISRIFIERTGVRTEYKDEAGYAFKDSIATSSPYKLYEESIEEKDILTQLIKIAKKQHSTIAWWFDTWLDSPKKMDYEDRKKILHDIRKEIWENPKV